jgi:hypothetical protein
MHVARDQRAVTLSIVEETRVTPGLERMRSTKQYLPVAWAINWNVAIELNWVYAILGGHLRVYIHIVVPEMYESDSTDTGPDSVRE